MTETENNARLICNQISGVFSIGTCQMALDDIVSEIYDVHLRQGAVFIYGVNREALMLKCFATRLNHLGVRVHVIHDINCPPIADKDLLVTSSGQGDIKSVETFARIAKSEGARVLIITGQPNKVSSLAHCTAFIPAQMMADRPESPDFRHILPLGSLYEGAMHIMFEMAIVRLTELFHQTPDKIKARHTNLE